ncbi:MAG: termination factor Rho [Solibacillus isronensis]
MTKHKVVREFKDTKHNGHIYKVGDSYPKEGEKATKARLEELSSTKNKYKKIYIEEVETPDKKE